MLNLRKIAITGGVASGKSTVCEFFKELGAYVVSSDAIVHELLTPGTKLCRQVSDLLGIYETKNGEAFRKAIAEKVFKDPKLLENLETILHPETLKKIETIYKEISQKEIYSSFVVEMPLLFEINVEGFYDTTITVLTDEKVAKTRFQKDAYENRMKRQLSPKKKASLSDFVIKNNGSMDDLKKQVIQINKTLQEL